MKTTIQIEIRAYRTIEARDGEKKNYIVVGYCRPGEDLVKMVHSHKNSDYKFIALYKSGVKLIDIEQALRLLDCNMM